MTRKSGDQPQASSSSVNKSPHQSRKTLEEERKSSDRLFFKYADKESGIIEPNGILALCSDLEVDHTDILILKFAWIMGAKKQGYITLAEWRRGLEQLEVTCLTELLDALRDKYEVLELDDYDDFYRFAFRFCLVEQGQKCLDIETTCAMLDVVLGCAYYDELDSLGEFLREQTTYKAITMDQWLGFYRFFIKFDFPCIDGYDDSEAWPLIVDDFVEWLKAKGQDKDADNKPHA